MAEPKPYTLNVGSDFVNWVSQRVKTAHIVPDLQHKPGDEWRDGTPTATVQELIDYWRDQYDWQTVEKKINETYPMFTLPIEEEDETIDLHFVHLRSEREDAVPLLFAHGWPGNFTEVRHFLKLANPSDPKKQAFHIIAPSLPGFTLSSSPKKPGFNVPRIARVYHKLMLSLGYPHYLGQAGDWGSFTLRSMALQFPENVIGIHLNFPLCALPSPFKNPLTLFYLAIGWLSPDEKSRVERLKEWRKNGYGYAHIQGTKPQTISYALLDSPVGMLGWIKEKLRDFDFYTWDKEDVITFTMLYLYSGSAGHARIYKENQDLTQTVLEKKISPSVAVGASCFPKDVGYAPKWWAQANSFSNIVFWREHQKGGHFASIEVPELLLGDVQEWASAVRKNEKRWSLLRKGGNASARL